MKKRSADFVRNISNEKNLIIDGYKANGKKIEVCYSFGQKIKISIPEGDYEAFDMCGNEIETGRKLTITKSPIYIIY